jgi:hypothetical protein
VKRHLKVKRNVIFDAGILTLFFAGDSRVQPFFQKGKEVRRAYVTSINLTEFYYRTCQTLGAQIAKLRYHQCRQVLEIIETSSSLSLQAGEEKCHGRETFSLADCFAIAATRNLRGTLLTTDPELSKIKDVDVRTFEVL